MTKKNKRSKKELQSIISEIVKGDYQHSNIHSEVLLLEKLMSREQKERQPHF